MTVPAERPNRNRDYFEISDSAAVRSLLGEAPERLGGHGSGLVLRDRGVVVKMGRGAQRETYCLRRRLPLNVPEVIASGDDWVAMEEVADNGEDWDESNIGALVDDLAMLHDAFLGADLRGTPVDVPLRDYFARIAGYGTGLDRLPEVVREAIENPERLLAVLAAGPMTLVHGDPYRGNIRRPNPGVRVWIDWEDAIAGPAALDIAALMLEGPWLLGRSLDRDRLVRRYLAARTTGIGPGLDRELDAATLMITLSQNIAELEATQGPTAVNAFIGQRIAAVRRLALA